MTYISFVVDKLVLHYYQAELLLYSIVKNTHYKKSNIIVQCLNRVDKYFLDYLTDHGYNYILIEPYLDGKYCNKLQQLEYFKDKNYNVILLDTDMFVLSSLEIPDENYICGKVVDAPNPPLVVLEHIFNEAYIEIPLITSSDWDMPNNQTFSCNFNGGFYYIPNKYVNEISSTWKKWATWLYERSELFETPQQFIHTDQISMAMAIASTGATYRNLNANANYPIHVNCELTSFQSSNKISILHYHREINEFGILNTNNISNQYIINSINNANKDIIQMGESKFYTKYHHSLIREPLRTYNLGTIEVKLKQLSQQYANQLKLFFHAGTPKTGTTTLQFFFDHNRDILLKNGIMYAPRDNSSYEPKQQWIVSCLINNDLNSFMKHLEQVLTIIDTHIHTVIFSTEGIYNHWWDFSPEAKYFLQRFSYYFNIELWTWFRDPLSFTDSLYRQYLKNPKVEGIECYGASQSISEMLKNDWFIKHIDYLGFILDAEQIFGTKNVKIFKMHGDIVKKVCTLLNINININNIKNQNKSLGNTSTQLLRRLNDFPLTHNEKTQILHSLSKIDTIIQKYDTYPLLSVDEAEKIKRLFAAQSYILDEKYLLNWECTE